MSTSKKTENEETPEETGRNLEMPERVESVWEIARRSEQTSKPNLKPSKSETLKNSEPTCENLANRAFPLISGDVMPLCGFGTYRIQGVEAMNDVLDAALSAGCRLIDTAVVYTNEEAIGEALKVLLPRHKLTRKDIFIISKLPLNSFGKLETILKVVEASLTRLQMEYIDLYLIHWPGQQGTNVKDSDNAKVRDLTWQALIEAQNLGLLRNIGVSNYTVRHLKELIDNDHGVMPAVNQVEWNPFYHQSELLKLCQDNDILLQAYTSLGGTHSQTLFKNPQVVQISKKLGQYPPQVLLAWALQQGVGVIPKSICRAHIIANFTLQFVISDADMAILNNLPQHKFAWDPTKVP